VARVWTPVRIDSQANIKYDPRGLVRITLKGSTHRFNIDATDFADLV